MRQKCIFINDFTLDEYSNDFSNRGGIAVQLNIWADGFVREGWRVITRTSDDSYTRGNIEYRHYGDWGHFEIIHELLVAFYYIVFRHPDCIMIRGARRSLYFNALLSAMFRRRLLFFGASDVNFIPSREFVGGCRMNTLLYLRALRYVSDFVVQNRCQQETLLENYHRESIIVPNVWKRFTLPQTNVPPFDVVWVANIRSLKRPEWLFTAARQYPNIRFAMVGGPLVGIKEYCDKIEKEALLIDNITFFGSKPFLETCAIVKRSRLLACSSEFEGFPNTFLQAWSYGIPVVSTVDPNDFISDYGLGKVVSSVEMWVGEIEHLLADQELYNECRDNVIKFFDEHYTNGWNAGKLIEKLGL